LNGWQQEFGNKIEFLVVYIAEAHASDVWPLGNHVNLPSHKMFEDRVASSDILTGKYGLEIPILYDGMRNFFDEQFAVWPERYYLIRAGKMENIWSPTTEFGFDRDQIYATLSSVYSRL